VHQFWFEEPLEPERGAIRLPEFPGLCPALDEGKIAASAEL
jgi:hypothetical protein